MDFWIPQDFQAITQGRWLVPPGDPRASITGVGIDTRTLQPGQAFFAVKGETHDGHDHVAVAIDKGAAIVVVSDEKKISDLGFRISDLQSDRKPLHPSSALNPPSAIRDPQFPTNPKSEIRNSKSLPILLVPDTVLTLQQLARVWRDILKQRSVKVVAVTGSSGKTTTRNLIHTALSATLRGTQSPKSFNNHLGVPLTLLAAPASDDFVVAEVGTNHHGEIAQLASILRPDIAVITNIGHAHIGHFGSQDAIAVEKSSLLKFLQPGGVAVVNGSQPWTKDWHRLLPAGTRMVTFDAVMKRESDGSLRCDLAARDLSTDAVGMHFSVASARREPLRIDLPMLGAHNAENALVAVAVARELGVADEAMAAALGKAKGVAMRMELVRLGADSSHAGITVINDAYNANPDSMAAAIATLVSLPAERRVAILADMLELGEASAQEHRKLGQLLAQFLRGGELRVGLVILIGEAMGSAVGELSMPACDDRVVYVPRFGDDLPPRVAAMLHDGDLVLLKGSRGLRLERLLPAMKSRFAENVDPILSNGK